MTAATVSDVRDGHITVYLLAAPADQGFCEKVEKHLKPIALGSPVPIEILDDFNIVASTDREQHQARLLDADVVLSLVSADFIDDNAVYDRCQRALARFNEGKNVIVSVIIRNCLWKSTPLADLPVLPTNRVPVNRWEHEDDALTDIAEHLVESINQVARVELIAEPSAATDQAPPASTEPPAPGSHAPTRGLGPDRQVANLTDPTLARPIAPTPSPGAESLPPPEIAPVAPPDGSTAPAARTSGGGFRVVRRATGSVNVDWRDDYYRSLLKKRIWAYLIDYVLQMVLLMLAILPVSLTSSEEEPAGPAVLLMAVAIVAVFAGIPWMESRYRGTPGKIWLGLEITNPDGSPISFRRAFWRNILRTVVFYVYLTGIGLIIQIRRFREQKRLFHDEWSNTIIGERVHS